MTVIAKREILYVGTVGIAAWLCGLVFIDRKSNLLSKQKVNDAVEKLKKKNIKLWVFPEGNIQRNQNFWKNC